MDHKDRSRLLAVIGVVLVAAGCGLAFLGPLEAYCFYLFSEGGRFHYEGFGFGSFMFGVIAVQVIAYPLIGALLVTLGYGHVKARRWARTLALTVLWSWLVVGAPLIVAAFFVLAGTKDLTLAGGLAVIACLSLSYLVLPGFLIRFYNRRNIRETFELGGAAVRAETVSPSPGRLSGLPVPILVLSCLYLLYIVALAALLMFRGMFPLFGAFRYGLQGIVLLDVSMACLVCLIWGTLHRKHWAWWGSVVFFGLFTASTALSFSLSSYPAILSELAFPEAEMAFLGNVPVQSPLLAALIGLPLLVTWITAIVSKRHFVNATSTPAH